MKRPTQTSDPAAAPGGAHIVADIGGTHARFATVGSPERTLDHVDVMATADYARIDDAISDYIGRHGIEAVAGICMAVAGPAEQDRVLLPNSHWSFSKAALETAIGVPLLIINDFTAQALSIDLLREDELGWIGGPRPEGRGFRAVIGPGTGLGMAVQTPGGEIVPSEGGHVSFAPTNDHEIELLRQLLHRYGRVSIERILSGPGLENLYRANARLEGADPDSPGKTAPEIARLAEAGDILACRAVEDFFAVLATFAGDVALMTWATGGVYLSGGVLGKLIHLFDAVRFRERFEDKGRFREFCERVPIAWIAAGQPGLLGCMAALGAVRRTMSASDAGRGGDGSNLTGPAVEARSA